MAVDGGISLFRFQLRGRTKMARDSTDWLLMLMLLLWSVFAAVLRNPIPGPGVLKPGSPNPGFSAYGSSDEHPMVSGDSPGDSSGDSSGRPKDVAGRPKEEEGGAVQAKRKATGVAGGCLKGWVSGEN